MTSVSTPNRTKSIQLGPTHPLPTACLHELFEQRVAEHPDRTAIVHDQESLSYQELNAAANRVAWKLLDAGIQPGDLVGVHAERSIRMVVAMLGILKAGGVYLPIDPEHDTDRLDRIVEEAAPKLIMTNVDVAKWPNSFAGVPVWELRAAALFDDSRTDNPGLNITSDAIFYVVHTSGSTGPPKGVQLTHRNVVNLIQSNMRPGGMDFRCTLAFGPIGFDASINEWLTTLVGAGGKLVVIDARKRFSPETLFDVVAREEITTLLLNAMFVRTIFSNPDFVAMIPECVTNIQSTGQRLTLNGLMRDFFSGPCRLWNEYGPSESHVVTSMVVAMPTADDAPAIGFPIWNTGIAILDHKGQLVDVGARGEVYICGDSVGPGYLNNSPLTEERFPTLDVDGVPRRFYKTGDIGSFLGDGSLAYHGRDDDQIKIGGTPTTLGEIESALLQVTGVREAVVLKQPTATSGEIPIAFLVADGGLTERAVRANLKLLPKLHPREIQFVDSIPCTVNGKVDKQSLRQAAAGQVKRRTLKRRLTATERSVADLMSSILDDHLIPHDATFTDLGGDSLGVVELMTAFKQRLRTEVSVQQCLECSVEDLAIFVDGHALAEDETDLEEASCLSACFLTGVTGFLGAQLVADLLARTTLSVFCLVRASGKQEATRRLHNVLEKYGLWRDEFSTRLHPVVGDLTQKRLGLAERQYERLSNTVETIYHAAADVNFLRTFSALQRTNVSGVVNIVRFAQAGAGEPTPVHFISSSSVGDLLDVDELPESTIHDLKRRTTETSNYSKSKWCAERVLVHAENEGVPVAIYRLPRLTRRLRDPAGLGSHNLQDLMFLFTKACMQVGCMPLMEIRDDWLPVDCASEAIVKLSRDPATMGGVFNLAGCGPVEQAAIIDAASGDIRLVETDEWLTALQTGAAESDVCRQLLLLHDHLGGEFATLPMCDRRTRRRIAELGLDGSHGSTDLLAEYFRDWRTDPAFCRFSPIQGI